MASPNFAKKNPFMGMTVAQMKAYYDKKVRGKGLKAKDLKVLADQMQAAKKAAPKPKAAASKPATSKPKVKGKPPATDSRFMSSSSQYTGDALDKPKTKTVKSRGVGVKGRLPQQPKSTSKPTSRGVGVKGRGTGTPAPSRPGGRAERARRNPPAPAPKRSRLTIAQRRRARRGSR